MKKKRLQNTLVNKQKEKSGAVKKIISAVLIVGIAAATTFLAGMSPDEDNILKPFHPRNAEWVGYIVNANGKRVYAAGDTDLTKEAREVKCDVALVPIGGMYTMDAKKAAELVNMIQPEVAIPVHYGAIIGSEKDGKEFEGLVKLPTKVELKIKF